MKKDLFSIYSKVLFLLIAIMPMALTAQVQMNKVGDSPANMQFDEGSQPTVSSFFDEYRQTYPLTEENQMQTIRVNSDQIGTHHHFNQQYKGIDVIGAQYILHEKEGAIWYANGQLVHGIDMDVNPAINEQSALSIALTHIDAESYMWQSPANETFLKNEQNDPNATFYPQGELKLTTGRNDLTSENIRLVYRFDIYADTPLSRNWVDVDANTGEIVNTISRIHNTDVPGSGTSSYNGVVAMTVDDNTTNFRLRENTTHTAIVHTFDMLNGTNYGSAVDFTSAAATGPWDAVGVSAHWGAEATFLYFLNAHARNSLDDAGFGLLSYVHYSSSYNNAFWDGSRMTYGDGDGVNFTPLVCLDVVGHELTHGVTNFSSDLVYQGEPGALNESFSDIFGNLVEFAEEGAPGVGTGDWAMGEDITPSGLGIRNMANPNDFSDPDTYYGTFWASTTGGDNGGVHTNSGVQNFWFYLLAEGGTGTNDNGTPYTVVGIGLDDAGDIAYHNNNSFLTVNSDYAAARTGSISCAEALFGVGSQQALSTEAAWDAVGVTGGPTGPVNDLCDNAIEVFAGTTVAGTTLGAGLDAGAPTCDFAQTAGGVWYGVFGNGQLMTVNTCSTSDYDTRLAVYEGDCGALVCVDANDDFCGLQSEVTWFAANGSLYYILVHGYNATGTFELTTTTSAVPAPVITPTPGDFTFSVPVDGADAGVLNIANTGDPGAFDLTWSITKSETSSLVENINSANGSVEKPLNYFISEQTIENLNAEGYFDNFNSIGDLVNLEDQVFTDKTEFYKAISDALGAQNNYMVKDVMQYAEVTTNLPAVDGLSSSSNEISYLSPSGPPELVSESNFGGQPSPLLTTTTTITHSVAQTITPGSVSCNAGGIHVENSYWRSFVLADFGISSDFYVTNVEFGIEQAVAQYGSQLITVNLYTNTGGLFPLGTKTLIGSATYNLPDQALTMVTLPVNGLAPSGSELVVEILTPDGLPFGNSIWVGSNPDGQTGLSYISSDGCAITSPTDLGAIGFPDMHIVMNVTGQDEDNCSWLSVSPTSGTTAQGASDNVALSVDATGLPIGTHKCYLNVLNNSMYASMLSVPVTLHVGEYIELNTPGENTKWTQGGYYEILWTGAFDPGENVRIQLFKGGVFHSTLAFNTLNDGQFIWTVPALVDGCDYQIKIFRVSDPLIEDMSVNFCIGVPIVSFINPIEGITWQQGEYYPLKWNSTLGPAEQVRIQLWNSQGLYSTLAFTTDNDGLFNWIVPTNIPDGCDYYFKIFLLSNPDQFGTSPVFCFGVPSINVITPSQLAVWNENFYWYITWTSTIDPGDDVTIQLFKDGTYVDHLAFSTANDGVFVWTIPTGIYTYACDYQIRINSNSNPTDFGSSKLFCIDPPAAAAALTKDVSTDINESTSADMEMKVYPNPVSQNVSIDLSNLSGENLELSVYDSFGKRVWERSYNETKQSHVESIDMSKFSKGIYIVNLMNNGKLLQTKITKL